MTEQINLDPERYEIVLANNEVGIRHLMCGEVLISDATRLPLSEAMIATALHECGGR